MYKNDQVSGAGGALSKRPLIIAGLGLALVSGGCSSDVTRFNEPRFGLTESGAKPTAAPRPSAPMSGLSNNQATRQDTNTGSYEPSSGYRPATSRPNGEIRTAALPELRPSTPNVARPQYVANDREPVRDNVGRNDDQQRFRAQPAPSNRTRSNASEEIQVKRGDTLYGLSRRHGVSLDELMRVNGLTKANLKPGQVLRLPNGPASQPVAAPGISVRQQRPSRTVAPVASPENWNKSYTVKSGDSLYVIARRYGIKSADLQRYNGIADPRKVRPGKVLKVPGSSAIAARPRTTTTGPTTVALRTRTDTSARLSNPNNSRSGGTASRAGGSPRIAVLNSKPVLNPAKAAESPSVKVSPPTVRAPDTTKLRWPVRGKVISKFGRRSDGTHNDGINLEVPAGSDVKAAESGVVAYSGSELRGYGNLILVRHDNGWVTAYAHNRDILVKRGDKVSRGQVIAKAGKTGQVDRPQVHFELRRDAKPVDPTPYLETL